MSAIQWHRLDPATIETAIKTLLAETSRAGRSTAAVAAAVATCAGTARPAEPVVLWIVHHDRERASVAGALSPRRYQPTLGRSSVRRPVTDGAVLDAREKFVPPLGAERQYRAVRILRVPDQNMTDSR